MLQKAGRTLDLSQLRGPAGWDSRRIQKDAQQIEGIVAGLPLFRGLPRARLAAIARAARLLLVRRGGYVARRGEPLAGVFAVGEGMINVALRGSNGTERVLRFVGPGESFAEAAALLGRASAIDAVALADSVLAVIAAPPLRALMARDAALSLRMAALLAERMLTLLAEIEASELRPAAGRLAAYLLALAPPTRGAALTARLPATKTLIASRLGMKKETLSRLLHDLIIRRLIAVSQREIAILDPDTLRAIARS